MRVFEGAALEFTIDNVFKAGYYELVLRYEYIQAVDDWQDVRISITRLDGPPDLADVCADFIPQDDDKSTSLKSSSNNVIVLPPSCLEPKKRYKLRLDFVRSSSSASSASANNNGQSQREASILIDSVRFKKKYYLDINRKIGFKYYFVLKILLIPSIEDLPTLQGNDSEQLIEEFKYHRCKEAQLNIHLDEISQSCSKFICNIGVHSDSALPCDCNYF